MKDDQTLLKEMDKNLEDGDTDNFLDIIKLYEARKIQASKGIRQTDPSSARSLLQKLLKCEVYYCVGLKQPDQKPDADFLDLSKIKGQITVSKNLLYFEPDKNVPDEMQAVLDEEGLCLNHFSSCIDYKDILSIQKIRGMNSSGVHRKDLEEQKMYLYDYYI